MTPLGCVYKMGSMCVQLLCAADACFFNLGLYDASWPRKVSDLEKIIKKKSCEVQTSASRLKL